MSLLCSINNYYIMLYKRMQKTEQNIWQVSMIFFYTLQSTLYLRDYIFTIQTSFKFNQANGI